MPELNAWENFYIIVGSSAGALIGLQFVVVTLVGSRPRAGLGPLIAAFGTPAILHFESVLFLSAVISAPWKGMEVVSWFWGSLGLIGVVYIFVVIRRFKRQTSYKPVLEDWLFHVCLPILAYLVLTVSAFFAICQTRASLFFVATSTLLLLFIGIHNAWDTVAYTIANQKSE